MKTDGYNISDFLLFPVKFYEKLNDSKGFLILGMLLVGLVDFFLPDAPYVFNNLFTQKSSTDVAFNVAVASASVVFLGAIDVIFFSLPLYDLLKYLKKKEGTYHNASPVKVMKVYIMSHFLVVPVNTLFYYLITKDINENSSILLIYFSLAFYLLVLLWSSAIAARGINTLFRNSMILRRLTFTAAILWSFLINLAVGLQLKIWMSCLFR
jgi:hypothetical protein